MQQLFLKKANDNTPLFMAFQWLLIGFRIKSELSITYKTTQSDPSFSDLISYHSFPSPSHLTEHTSNDNKVSFTFIFILKIEEQGKKYQK